LWQGIDKEAILDTIKFNTANMAPSDEQAYIESQISGFIKLVKQFEELYII